MIKIRDSIISIAGVIISQGNFFLCIWLIGYYFGPEVLGQFNFLLSIGILVGTLFVFRYELSCISDSHKNASRALLNVLILIVFIGFFIVFTVFFVNKSLLIIIFFAIAYISLQAFYYFLNSIRKYCLIGIFKSSINLLFLLLITFFIFYKTNQPDYFSIYTICYFIILICALMFIVYNINIDKNSLHFRLFLKDNYRFPIYIFPSTCCSSILIYSLSIIIPKFYSLELAGYFAISYRLGSFPISLLAQSLSGVFRRDMISACSAKNAKTAEVIYFSYFKIFLVFVFGYLIFGVFLFGLVIEWIFGSEWKDATIYFYLMIPLFITQLLYIPLSQIFLVYQKQAIDFSINLIMAFCLMLLYVISYYFSFSLTLLILCFSIISSCILIIGLFITYKIMKKNDCNTY